MRSHIILSIAMFLHLLFAVNSHAQTNKQTNVSIEERLSTYLPLFQDPSCFTYLLDFGADADDIKIAAKSIGIEYFSKMPIVGIDDAYMFMYSDPDNIPDRYGVDATSSVLYIFSFTPSGDYFSFSSNLTFNTSRMAKDTYLYLAKYLGIPESEIGNQVSGVVTCDEKNSPLLGRDRLVTLRIDGKSVTIIIIDYDFLVEYMQLKRS